MPRQVVVLGSLNADLVVSVERLPQPGETVLGDRLRTFPGGKGGNQAVAAARLGADVTFVGRVGADEFGKMLTANLANEGVDTAGIQVDKSEPSGTAVIIVGAAGQNMIAVAPGVNARVGSADVGRAIARLGEGDILVLQLEIPVDSVALAISDAQAKGARVLLNAAPASPALPQLLKHVDVLVINEVEARALAGSPIEDFSDAIGVAREVTEGGVELSVITLGALGAVAADAAGAFQVDAPRVSTADTTGAGDAFVGALAAGLAAQLDSRLAVRIATTAGAAATARLGAQSSFPRLEELLQLLPEARRLTLAQRR